MEKTLLEKKLDETLKKLVSKDRVYMVGGKKCKLVKIGDRWTRKEL